MAPNLVSTRLALRGGGSQPRGNIDLEPVDDHMDQCDEDNLNQISNRFVCSFSEASKFNFPYYEWPREFVIVENIHQEIVNKNESQCSACVTKYRHE